jgi:two-component system phosphate regulon response regulator PhoB
MTTLLIIEDEAPIRDMLRFVLQQTNFSVMEAEDTKQAYTLLAKKIPDLILIDWMLPNASGVDFVGQLKKNPTTAEIPIIMLTARAEEENKITGLEAGVDDYVVKPFSPRELIARIHAVLRRTNMSNYKIEVDGLCLEPTQKKVTLDNKLLKLSPTEYRLLHFFMSHPNRIHSREKLLNRVWEMQMDIDERTVDASIRRLRRVLGPEYRKRILTVRGDGYQFHNKQFENDAE